MFEYPVGGHGPPLPLLPTPIPVI